MNELFGQKWAIKIMDDLIDDHPLTGGGKTTFELINNYLPILMGNYVNRRLTCGGKSGPHYCKISSNMHFCVIIGPNLKKNTVYMYNMHPYFHFPVKEMPIMV